MCSALLYLPRAADTMINTPTLWSFTLMRPILLTVLLAAMACGGDSAPTVSTSIVGTYVLQSVNGTHVPATVSTTASGRLVMLDDALTLNADHSYSESGHIQSIANNGVTVTSPGSDNGVYTNTNGTIAMTSTIGNGPSTGVISGTQLTMVVQGLAFVYTR